MNIYYLRFGKLSEQYKYKQHIFAVGVNSVVVKDWVKGVQEYCVKEPNVELPGLGLGTLFSPGGLFYSFIPEKNSTSAAHITFCVAKFGE